MTHAHQPAEVRLMPDPFDPTKLVITKAQAADRAAQQLERERADRAQQRQQRRRLKPTPREVTRGIAHQRELARDTRNYAEAWYQAIRNWKEDTYEVPAPAGSGRGGAVLLTSGTPGMITCAHLITPLGRLVTATEAGRIITTWAASAIPVQRDQGRLLERLRQGHGLASLLDERGGWNRNTSSARAYAAAVLNLAVILGDINAEVALESLKTCYDSVELDK